MKKPRSFSSKKIWIALLVLLVILLLIFLPGHLKPEEGTNPDPTVPGATQETQAALGIPDLVGAAKAIKSNLAWVMECIQYNDYQNARRALNTARSNMTSVRNLIEEKPFIIKLIPNGQSLYELLCATDTAIPELLLPAIDLLESRPLSSLSADGGFDMHVLFEYIDFLEAAMPQLENLVACANEADFSLFDSEGKIAGYLETANKLLALYHDHPGLLPMLKTMLGAYEDRVYLIAVQNPSEIRASGGFPGSMGMLRIKDGILTLGDFTSVTGFLTTWLPRNVRLTQEEVALFSYLSGMQTPRDADLCPDFERVGLIWGGSYEEKHKEPISGVISMTPHIVQRLLAALEEEIELSDGLVLDGNNAVKVLIHDIYFKYFDRNHPHPNKGAVSDGLFAEAAQKTVEKLTENLSVSRLLACLPVFTDSIADRTLMLWMKNEAEQAFVIDRGWSGTLNKDPQKPEAGIYVNVVSASKMGWFLLMDTQIGQRTKNADGSYTYPITVTYSNNITPEEINAADYYISGGLQGAMRTVVYFFAPAGGSIGDFTATNGQTIKLKTYNGMTLGFMEPFLLKPDVPITITYTVTTAPGVDTPLVFSKTPTGQQS